MGAKTTTLAVVGAVVGTIIAPGIGTVLGAKIGGGLGLATDAVDVGSNILGKRPRVTGDYHYSERCLRVVRIRVRSIWLRHGSYASVGSAITTVATGNPLTHWWVEIETEDNVWYCAQFGNQDLLLTRHYSSHSVTLEGFSCVGRSGRLNVTDKRSYSPSNRTIGDVIDMMEDYCNRGPYNLVSNNCQDFGEYFYQWI